MNPNEIKELVTLLAEKDIAEFEMERDDVKLRIKRSHEAPATTVVAASYPAPVAAPISMPAAAPMAAPAPAPAPAAAGAGAAAAPAAASDEGLAIIKSPIVGTYYEASSPGAPPYVREGDNVTVGQVLCIVEAMKLMNEIESDTAGQIVKILVSNGQPVEYGQPLFKIRPR